MKVLRKRRAERKTIFFFSDIHEPHSDQKALAAAENVCRHIKPEIIVNLGDLLDFYTISRYDKDPARKETLQDELDLGTAFFRRIRKDHPDAEIFWKEGNHEERLRKYLWSKARELSCLRALDLTELMGLKDLGIRFVRAGERLKIGPLVVSHGHVVRGNSGYSANGEMTKRGVSGISGHTHRLGQVFHTNDRGSASWVEAGCLCKLDAEYIGDYAPNWQHGCVVGHWIKAHDVNRISLQVVPIIDGTADYQGNLITHEGIYTA